MKNEGWFLIAFILLAVILLVMVSRADRSKEHFDPPVDTATRVSTLETEVKTLDDRMSKAETTLHDQEQQITKAKSDVDTATTQIQMVNS
jgi:predicted  nucleic acid-binding Zn-ribbon protein